MSKQWTKRTAILLTVILLLGTLLGTAGCGETPMGKDPFAAVRGDFDAELRWRATSLTAAPGGEVGAAARVEEVIYTATLTRRGGELCLKFTAPEALSGMTVTERADGSISVERNGTELAGSGFGRLLHAARLVVGTGEITERTEENRVITLTYLAKTSDGGQRTRTMTTTGEGVPLSVTEAGGEAVEILWFEPQR